MRGVPDRLRDLIDLVIDSLDEPDANGRLLADRAHFSRDHLDRLLAAATGESPVALRRRLLLEHAAWQLRTAAASPTEAAAGLRQDLHVGTILDQQGQPGADHGQRVDDDHPQTPDAGCRRWRHESGALGHDLRMR